MSPTAWQLVVVGTTALVSAASAVLLARRAAREASLALLLTAVGMVVAVLLQTAGHDHAALRVALAAGLLLLPLVVLLYPRPRVDHPVGYLSLVTVLGAGGLATWRPTTAPTMELVLPFVLVGHTWWALERSQGPERRALTWLALSGAIAAFAGGVLLFLGDEASGTAWSVLPLAIVGPALFLGVVQRELVDVRRLVVDVVAHVTTALAVLAVFVGVAGFVVDARVGAGALPVLGLLAAALAAGYHVTHRTLRDVVEQVLLGHRVDPLTTVRRVSQRIGEDPRDALLAVRESLALPWLAVLADPPVTTGTRPALCVRLPLGEGMPDLEVGLRPDETRLSRPDERLLALAGPILGQSFTLHALAAELQETRELSVRAVEEERLRLRRDLHDGLGPLLSGMAFTVDAARNLLRVDPEQSDALLLDARGRVATALEDVRRLVYGMRPPALDELGLVGAVEQVVSATATQDGRRLLVTLDAPEHVELPAAVEVAAYRIIVEGLGNAARHSRAQGVRLTLRATDAQVRIEVSDPGPHVAAGGWRRGVGVSSMAERATELGGTLEAGPTDTGGWRVLARLPIRAQASTSS